MDPSLPERPAPDAPPGRWLAAVTRLMGLPQACPARFSVGVSGAVLDHRGRLLLLRHAFRRRYPWGLVSGWVDAGEAPEDAMRRELREETSLVGEVGPIIAIRSDWRAPSLEVVYLVSTSAGEFRPSPETPEAAWFAETDPLPDGLHPSQRALVALARRDAVAGRRGR